MRIFLSVASLAQHYGGPARSVSRLARALGGAGIGVGIWAPDGSAVDSPFLQNAPEVQRLDGTLEKAFESFKGVDLLHDNGIWWPHNHALASLATRHKIPRIVSTRGMLEPWALKHKRWKKWLAWRLYQNRDLQAAACHHVTAPLEATRVSAFHWKVPVCCIPNGIEPVAGCARPEDLRRQRWDGEGPRTALFLGRIYPVKGLPLLIRAWDRVRPAGWVLKIAGPDEAGHRAEVEALVQQCGLGGQVQFTGELEGEGRRTAYEEASLFLQPSYSENFGMAIGEAMAHGLPVITTQGTPWELLKTAGCGWWVPASVDGIASALQEATQQKPGVLEQMGSKGCQIVAGRFVWERIAGQFIDCYHWLLGQKQKPAWMDE